MTLTDGEKMTSLWLRLEEHFTDRLLMLRQSNDKAQPELETALMRGRIAEVKGFLSLAKEQPIID